MEVAIPVKILLSSKSGQQFHRERARTASYARLINHRDGEHPKLEAALHNVTRNQ